MTADTPQVPKPPGLSRTSESAGTPRSPEPAASSPPGADAAGTRGQGRVLLGTQGWNYADWVGGFYPAGTRPADFLSTYARAFRAVEVDSTFYAVPVAKTVRGWAERTPPGFTFALKMPQEATHERRLVDAEDVTERFFDVARELGEKLGPVLLQMGPDFGPDELPALARFLPRVPADVRAAVEVRHAGWNGPGMLDALRVLLQEHGAALALSDGRWMPRSTVLDLAARPTADFHYVRWMGPDRSITRFSQVLVDRADEMDAWAAALQPVLGRAVSLFGFFNNHFAGHSPANARDMQRRLGDLPVDPRTLDEQTSLF
ncbi:MAG: hypothetical protein JWM27_2528 [Gemmatimonadetes bacterium]|nr:hypothetical protein [Gemmatimonadota bacterium]